jgi:hypothetical protein
MPQYETSRPSARRAGGLALVALVAAASVAAAQPPAGPVLRPTTSPYLNLLQGNTPAAANYYGVVRPVQEFRRQNVQFANQLGSLQGQVAQQGVQADLPETGHVAGFMNAGGYFRNQNAGGNPRGGSVAPPAVNNAPPMGGGGTRPPARR